MGRSLYCICILVFLLGASAVAQRSFSKRVGFNAKGDLLIVGNVNMRGYTSTSGNTFKGNDDPNANDNDCFMRHSDIDNDPNTFNSSSATLTLPVPGDSVLWAGLYWQGYSYSGYVQSGTTANAYNNRFKVKFRKGTGTYTEYTATQQDDITSNPYNNGGHNFYAYQGFYDVTAAVKIGGTGDYYAANIVGSHNEIGVIGGWALIVIFKQFAGNVTKNMVVFDGYQEVVPSSNVTIPVSGFKTPSSGSVYSEVGVVAFEGDAGFNQDRLRLGATTYLTDSQNPSTNFFNSSISALGTRVTAKYPDFLNQLGYDIDVIATTGLIPNNTTATSIRLETGSDRYFPGVVTFETEIHGPVTTAEKMFYAAGSYMSTLIVSFPPNTIANRTLQYHFNFENIGEESAIKTKLIDTIPERQDYINGSMQVSMNGTTWTNLTDAADGDAGYYDAANNRVIIGIGNNATSSNGGQLLSNSLRMARFKTLIKDPTTYPPGPYDIPNFAKVFYEDTAAYAYEANSSGVMLNISNALPVELVAFAARAQDGNAILEWRTATESNNYGFEVERSAANGGWNTVAFVPGHGTCNTPNSYRITDKGASAFGALLGYRLKMLDRNGDVQYSDIVELSFGAPELSGFASIFPNPIRGGKASVIRYTINAPATIRLSVYDVYGKSVARLAEGPADAGSYSATFFTGDLPSGMYIIELVNGSERTTTKVIVKK